MQIQSGQGTGSRTFYQLGVAFYAGKNKRFSLTRRQSGMCPTCHLLTCVCLYKWFSGTRLTRTESVGG